MLLSSLWCEIVSQLLQLSMSQIETGVAVQHNSSQMDCLLAPPNLLPIRLRSRIVASLFF